MANRPTASKRSAGRNCWSRRSTNSTAAGSAFAGHIQRTPTAAFLRGATNSWFRRVWRRSSLEGEIGYWLLAVDYWRLAESGIGRWTTVVAGGPISKDQ